MWEQGFTALEAYKREFGDSQVPNRFVYHGAQLGRWLGTQRKNKNQLSADQIARLDALGFIWDVLTEQCERPL